jgi:hypothetical protein
MLPAPWIIFPSTNSTPRSFISQARRNSHFLETLYCVVAVFDARELPIGSLSKKLEVWRLGRYFGVSSQFWFQGLGIEIKIRKTADTFPPPQLA